MTQGHGSDVADEPELLARFNRIGCRVDTAPHRARRCERAQRCGTMRCDAPASSRCRDSSGYLSVPSKRAHAIIHTDRNAIPHGSSTIVYKLGIRYTDLVTDLF
jgi:hypothetical protein